MTKTAVLLDLDNTLYHYDPCDRAAETILEWLSPFNLTGTSSYPHRESFWRDKAQTRSYATALDRL